MTYTYRINHEAIVLGTTTIKSETELTVDELKVRIGSDGSELPGAFEPSGESPVMYGSVLSIAGDLTYDS